MSIPPQDDRLGFRTGGASLNDLDFRSAVEYRQIGRNRLTHTVPTALRSASMPNVVSDSLARASLRIWLRSWLPSSACDANACGRSSVEPIGPNPVETTGPRRPLEPHIVQHQYGPHFQRLQCYKRILRICRLSPLNRTYPDSSTAGIRAAAGNAKVNAPSTEELLRTDRISSTCTFAAIG